MKKPEILNLFDEYLFFGGFPEVIRAGKRDKIDVIRSVFNLLFYKDLIVKFGKNEYIIL